MITHSISMGSSPAPADKTPAKTKRGRRWLRTVAAVAGLAFVATSCTGGPGSEADFVDILVLNDNFNEVQASCIAESVFDEYGDDGDAIQKISGAESYEYLIGEDGVDGFGTFFDGVVSGCVTAGPSPSDS